MQEYWQIISKAHRKKLEAAAKAKGVSRETAMRNLVNYLKSDNENMGRPDYFRDCVTARQIESVIDIIIT